MIIEKLLKYKNVFRSKGHRRQEAEAIAKLHPMKEKKLVCSAFETELMKDFLSILNVRMKQHDEDFGNYANELLILLTEFKKVVDIESGEK